MPDGISAGAPVNIGNGPDQIQIVAGCNPNHASPPAVFAVLVNGSVVAGPLTCTSFGGQAVSNSQVFTIKGAWGPGPINVGIVGTGTGMANFFINSVTYNFVPYEVAPNQFSIYDDGGYGTGWILPPSGNTPGATGGGGGGAVGAGSATPSNITGATINGATQAAAPIQTLLTATPAGATLLLPAGAFYGTSTVPTACVVAGSGMGKTTLDCTGERPTHSKAVLVPIVGGATIRDMTLMGASISSGDGGNAAGVREDGVGMPFNLTNVEITGCQNGLLTFADNLVLTGGHTHDNGNSDGQTHEIYVNGSPTSILKIDNWVSTCGLKSTHALKSRAGTTSVTGGTFTGNPDPTGNVGGSVVDAPEGGVFNATGSTFVTGQGAANTLFFGYAMENANNQATGTTATFTDCVFTDNTGSGGKIQNGTFIPSATLVLVNCTYTGATAPVIAGFASVSGAITKAA